MKEKLISKIIVLQFIGCIMTVLIGGYALFRQPMNAVINKPSFQRSIDAASSIPELRGLASNMLTMADNATQLPHISFSLLVAVNIVFVWVYLLTTKWLRDLRKLGGDVRSHT